MVRQSGSNTVRGVQPAVSLLLRDALTSLPFVCAHVLVSQACA